MGNNTFRESDLMAILEGVNDGVIKLDHDGNYHLHWEAAEPLVVPTQIYPEKRPFEGRPWRRGIAPLPQRHLQI
jgi:hypothetical protein